MGPSVHVGGGDNGVRHALLPLGQRCDSSVRLLPTHGASGFRAQAHVASIECGDFAMVGVKACVNRVLSPSALMVTPVISARRWVCRAVAPSPSRLTLRSTGPAGHVGSSSGHRRRRAG